MSFRYRLVGFGYHLLYNELAWTYDAVAWLVSKGDWQAWGQTILEFVVGPRVLEVGFGPGHLLAVLGQRGYRVSGLDLSAAMLRRARRGMDGGALAQLVRGRAEALPFAAAAFDSVVMTFPAAFVVREQTRREVWRVLRPGGVWIIVDAARLAGRGPWARLVNLAFELTSLSLTPETLREMFAPEAEAGEPAGEVNPLPRFDLSSREVSTRHGVVRVLLARRSPGDE